MKRETGSYTAQYVAAYRAAESRRPEGARVCFDPYAMDFLDPWLKAMVRSRLLTRLALWSFRWRFPGTDTFSSVVARVRYIDEYLSARVDEGIEQLVLLGAGFDTRVHRFGRLRTRTKVFEVDHPSTQQAKTARVIERFGALPPNVVYVAVDFDAEDLGEKLIHNGYRTDAKTVFIWEGVTMYLSPEAIDKTLTFVERCSAEGSSLIFDYVFHSFIAGTYDDGRLRQKVVRKALAYFERLGEPMTFGLPPEDVESYLAGKGFDRIHNVTGRFLENAYFREGEERRIVNYPMGIVHATVGRATEARTAAGQDRKVA